MRTISRSIINAFIARYPESAEVLRTWYAIVDAADWSTFQDMKDTFNTVDLIGDNHYVFNVGGNKYRIIALIFLPSRRVYLRAILTHKEYDKLSRKQILEM
ncbi:type II toxin-antitoxin system HigB family toxin [Hymenobacter aerilatus]|uniref:Type II toxin-antitoxin system HigB family toxin n=1 Tax=Hymenobacter aerilatus TaxID=2932251 RepID=A0A8T9T010_9BACT|nr:type II toxin-antitoxin system HigB family toxin [Hymenobacter aerilatus]UOR07465.1 type II toxin-antitoxin system HigB family toxin [Hymenobacter aerilatus]